MANFKRKLFKKGQKDHMSAGVQKGLSIFQIYRETTELNFISLNESLGFIARQKSFL